VDSPKKRPEIDWSKIRVGNVYLDTLSPEERKKFEPFLTPEKRAEYKRIAELEDQDREWVRAEAEKWHEEAMRKGIVPRTARFVLMQERNRQGLSDEEMMTRSGLDAEALASMSGRDAKPTIEIMEAYARALGKQLLIALADADNSEES
jgi:ribosome-binding protein aMBF1 (putative translation factor)